MITHSLVYLASVVALASPDGAPAPATTAAAIQVAAAADLQGAFTELGKAFEAEGNGKVSFTFGSTGLLARQLKEGAPFDMFAAANVAFVDDVVAAGVCDGASKAQYARGRIVVWTRKDAKVTPPKDLADVADARFLHVAIANPEHAPYGIAAREALTSVGVWEKLQPRLALSENVRQTLQLAETGNADVAIVALSVAIPGSTGSFFVVDDKLHRPLNQALVVCTKGRQRKGGDAFAHLVASQKGKDTLKRFGFAIPGEPLPTAPATP